MAKLLCVVMLCIATIPAVSQSSSPKPQVATISAVDVHKNEPGDNVVKYDVSLKIGDSAYVVLFTPPSGSKGVEYAVGQDVLALVGPEKITVTRFGHTSESQILSREDLPSKSGIDWQRAPGEYFSQKLRNLSEKLDLTDDQQAKVKPILEQEAAEAGQITKNPVLSREDKLDKLQKIVNSSDQKIKPILSSPQWGTLQKLRKEQKQEIKELLASSSQGG